MKVYSIPVNVVQFKAAKKETATVCNERFDSSKSPSCVLENSLNILATNAIANVDMFNKSVKLPKSLYHLTTKANYERIIQSGKLMTSSWEKVQEGLDGVYMLGKDNFLNTWFDKKYPSIFAKKEDVKKQPSMGEQILKWTSRGGDVVAIEIPTSKLDMSKLRIRPYLQAYNQVIETMNVETDEYDDELFRYGLPLSKLSDYEGTDEPIEFVYVDEIPANIFSSAKQFSLSIPSRELAREIFS